jgi:hypothetical protein
VGHPTSIRSFDARHYWLVAGVSSGARSLRLALRQYWFDCINWGVEHPIDQHVCGAALVPMWGGNVIQFGLAGNALRKCC